MSMALDSRKSVVGPVMSFSANTDAPMEGAGGKPLEQISIFIDRLY